MRFPERLTLIVDNCIKLKLGEWIENDTVFHIHDVSLF